MTFCRARLKQVVVTTRRCAQSHRNGILLKTFDSTAWRLNVSWMAHGCGEPVCSMYSQHILRSQRRCGHCCHCWLFARGGLNDWNVIGSSRMQWPSVRHENSVIGNARCLEGPRLSAPFSIAHHRARERTPKRRETWSEFNVRLG